MRWLVVLTPAVAGVVSLVLSPNEDLRSSGLMAGVGLSLLLASGLLALRAPWRSREGAAGLAVRGGVACLVVVGVLGLAGGVPDLLRERFGLLLSADDRGLLAVAVVDGGFVAVGHPETGAAWTSSDGESWTQVRLPAGADDLALRALAPAGGTLWAVAEEQTDAGLLVEVPGLDADWAVGSRFVRPPHGQRPMAAAELGGQLLTFGSTYSNDVMFFRGDPHETLHATGPEPAGDRGYSARDLACSDRGCVAVGAHWEPAAAFWHTTDGNDWQRSHLDPNAVDATGVVSTVEGWLTVGDGGDNTAVAWRSADGRTWERDAALELPEAVMAGVAVTKQEVIAYGHDTRSDRAVLWVLDGNGWRQIDLGGPAGSRVRGVATSGDGTLVAVGVDGEALRAATWVSASGSSSRFVALDPSGR